MAMSVCKLSAALLIGAMSLSACGAGPSGDPSVATVGSPAVAGIPVALNTSGQDSCGAVDHGFLHGQPFAHTFDIALPAGTRILGRRQTADVQDPGRLSLVVSTRSPSMAAFTANAKILRVFCG